MRWLLLGSPDEANWVVVDDQSTTSYPVPVERLVFGPPVLIDAMQPVDIEVTINPKHLGKLDTLNPGYKP